MTTSPDPIDAPAAQPKTAKQSLEDALANYQRFCRQEAETEKLLADTTAQQEALVAAHDLDMPTAPAELSRLNLIIASAPVKLTHLAAQKAQALKAIDESAIGVAEGKWSVVQDIKAAWLSAFADAVRPFVDEKGLAQVLPHWFRETTAGKAVAQAEHELKGLNQFHPKDPMERCRRALAARLPSPPTLEN